MVPAPTDIGESLPVFENRYYSVKGKVEKLLDDAYQAMEAGIKELSSKTAGNNNEFRGRLGLIVDEAGRVHPVGKDRFDGIWASGGAHLGGIYRGRFVEYSDRKNLKIEWRGNTGTEEYEEAKGIECDDGDGTIHLVDEGNTRIAAFIPLGEIRALKIETKPTEDNLKVLEGMLNGLKKAGEAGSEKTK